VANTRLREPTCPNHAAAVAPPAADLPDSPARCEAHPANRLHEFLQAEHMRQPEEIEQAVGLQLRGLIRQLDAVCTLLTELEEQIDRAFPAHPDAPILSSFPGLGVALGARLLAEIDDDHTRFADARAFKAFAGAAPVTRASGRTRFVHPRRAKNDRIAATGYVWALAAIRHDPCGRNINGYGAGRVIPAACATATASRAQASATGQALGLDMTSPMVSPVAQVVPEKGDVHDELLPHHLVGVVEQLHREPRGAPHLIGGLEVGPWQRGAAHQCRRTRPDTVPGRGRAAGAHVVSRGGGRVRRTGTRGTGLRVPGISQRAARGERGGVALGLAAAPDGQDRVG
jgi:hypothetical protein